VCAGKRVGTTIVGVRPLNGLGTNTDIGKKTRKISCEDVRKGYTEEKARRDLTTEPWTYYVLRPLSFVITPFFIRIGLGANAVTLLGLVPLLSGIVFILFGSVSYSGFIIGAIFLNIWYLFDVIDGNIARFQETDSKYGALLDWTIGNICHILLPLCLGIGVYFSSFARPVFDFGLNLPSWFWLWISLVGLISNLFQNLVSLKGQAVVGEKIANRIEYEISFRSILPRAIISSQLPMLFIASALNGLGIFIAFFSFYKVLVLFVMIIMTLKKARISDKSKLK